MLYFSLEAQGNTSASTASVIALWTVWTNQGTQNNTAKPSLNSHGKDSVKYSWNISSRREKLKHKKGYNNNFFLVSALFIGSCSDCGTQSSGNECFVFKYSVGWSQRTSQAGLPAHTPCEASNPRSTRFVRKWVRAKSLWGQCKDGPRSFGRISWIGSCEWDLRPDHSALHPDLLPESLEWFWIYADINRKRISPFFPTLACNKELPAQFISLVLLFPLISSLPRVLHTLAIDMTNRSLQMAPTGTV